MNIHKKLRDWIAVKVFDKDWLWLSLFLSILCDIEMALPLLSKPEWYHKIQTAQVIRVYPQRETESYAQQVVPKDTLYCQDCPFYNKSKIATFFYGNQCNGYCYLLGKGDYSFMQPTDILWDFCKCCGINDPHSYEENIHEI